MSENPPRASFENVRFQRGRVKRTGLTGQTGDAAQVDEQSVEIIREKTLPGEIFDPTNKAIFQDPFEHGLLQERAQLDNTIVVGKTNQEVQQNSAHGTPTTEVNLLAAIAQLRQGYIQWNFASGIGDQAAVALHYYINAAASVLPRKPTPVEFGYTRADGTYTKGFVYNTDPIAPVLDVLDGIQYPNTITVGKKMRSVLMVGHMIGLGTGVPGLVPACLDYQLWNAFISRQTGGSDTGGGDLNNVGLFNPYGRTPSELQAGWTDDASVVHYGYEQMAASGGAGITTSPNPVNGYNELRVFPSINTVPGSFGFLSLDNGNDASTNAVNWWLNGISSGDRTALLAVQGPFSGHSDVLYPITAIDLLSGLGTHHDVNILDWHGATGIKESDVKNLGNNGVQGSSGLLPLFAPAVPTIGNTYTAADFNASYGYDNVGAVGTNAYFNIIGYAGVLVTSIHDFGGRLGTQILMQPYGIVPNNCTYDPASVAPAKTANFSYIFTPSFVVYL